jgi:hypothetical protein
LQTRQDELGSGIVSAGDSLFLLQITLKNSALFSLPC